MLLLLCGCLGLLSRILPLRLLLLLLTRLIGNVHVLAHSTIRSSSATRHANVSSCSVKCVRSGNSVAMYWPQDSSGYGKNMGVPHVGCNEHVRYAHVCRRDKYSPHARVEGQGAVVLPPPQPAVVMYVDAEGGNGAGAVVVLQIRAGPRG
jgi:hypothetical protein